VAHENVENKQTLDTFAWNIENRIYSFYYNEGDYEKGEYF
jgi:hypothetical protein